MPTRVRRLGLSVVFLVLSTGCSLVSSRLDSHPPSGLDAKTLFYSTQVAMGQCVLTPVEEFAPFAAIGGALLSNAVNEGINRLGIALEEAAKEQTWTVKASRNLEVNRDQFGPCLQIVRGWFYMDPLDEKAQTAAAEAWFKSDFIDKPKFILLRQNGLWLAAPPDFAFEGVLDPALNQRASVLKPRYVRLDEPIARRWLRPGKDRHVAVFVAFHPASSAADLERNPSASLILGRLSVAEAKLYDYPKSVPKKAQANRSPHESGWFTPSFPGDKTEIENLTVSVAVAETQRANEFLSFIAAVFKSSKGTITEQVQSVLVPKTAAEVETERAARETLLTKYDEKLSGALTNVAKCGTGGDDFTTIAVNARKALRELNQATRALGRDNVVSESDITSIKLSSETDKEAATKEVCKRILTTLQNL